MRDIYAIARAVRQSHISTCVVVLAARRSRLHHLSREGFVPKRDGDGYDFDEKIDTGRSA